VFTGLIADLGSILAAESNGDGTTLRIQTALAAELGVGDSIAVNGVCLTATRVGGEVSPVAARGGAGSAAGAAPVDGDTARRDGGIFEAQAIRETLERSTLGALEVGDPVNLELALRADGRLGGHIVQGHVDGVGTIVGVREEGFSHVVAIETAPDLLLYVVEKGSIAIDGVSLTVSALRENGFEVSLIPETLERTTLGGVLAGARVNLEADILAKHVERLLAARVSQS
jgi:riboflavin synthase